MVPIGNLSFWFKKMVRAENAVMFQRRSADGKTALFSNDKRLFGVIGHGWFLSFLLGAEIAPIRWS